jgi:hypothetical protein
MPTTISRRAVAEDRKDARGGAKWMVAEEE